MLEIDPRSPVPINDQIKAGLKGLVTKGLLKPGDQAPSVRALAVSLRVNPNTVARAFRELGQEGFLETRRGEGAYISDKGSRQARDGFGDLKRALEDALRMARRGGLPWSEIEAILRKARGDDR